MQINRSLIVAVAMCGFGAASSVAAEPTPAKIVAPAPTLTNVKVTEETKVITPDALEKLRAEDGTTQVLPVAPRRFAYEVLTAPTVSAELKAEEERLSKHASTKFVFMDMPLTDAIRTIADTAGMSSFAPRNKGVFNEKITLKVTSKPYEMLKALADTYGFAMEFKDGKWRFYEVNIGELVSRTYKIRYNDLSVAELTPTNINNSLSRGGQNAPTAQDTNGSIKADASALINGVKEILARPTTGLKLPDANSAPGYSAGQTPVTTAGTVKYSPDSNTLEVWGTRQQHEYIKQWLATVDVPQRLVQIETQFVEVADGDDSNLGLDASGIGATKVGVSGLTSGPINFDKGSKTPYPSNAVVSVSDSSVLINALMSKTSASMLSNPILVTTNNRKVTLGSTKQIPIQSANNNQTTGAGTTNTASIDYLEIGTKVSVLPLVIEASPIYGNKPAVRCDITITLSSQQGTQVIDGRDYPIVSSRTYAYSVVVPDMHTLAIAGLRDTKTQETKKYVPILGWIPGVREIPYIGNNKSSSIAATNLHAFLTPRVLGQQDFDASSGSTRLMKKDDAIAAAQYEGGFFTSWSADREKFYGKAERANAATPVGEATGSPEVMDAEWQTVKFKPTSAAKVTSDSSPSPASNPVRDAIAADQAGDTETAKAKLREVIATDPTNQAAKDMLADLEAQKKPVQEAK